jgi:integrase
VNEIAIEIRKAKLRELQKVGPKIYNSSEIQEIINILPLPYVAGGKPTWRFSAYFWVPLVALFSGLRQSEIRQLRKTDIVEHDAVLCIKVDEEEDGERLVPIHSKLIQLGFVEFAGSQGGPLFSGLNGRFSDASRSGQMLEPGKHLLYAPIRLAVEKQLQGAGIATALISVLLGQNYPEAKASQTSPSIGTLRDAIEKITYEGVSLDRLKPPSPASP